MKHDLPRNIAIALLIAFIYVGAGAAPAAETQRRQSAGEEATVSDRDLKAFVKAYVDYQRIRASYGPALENTKDPARKKQLEQEANAKIKHSLDATGLSPDRYNRIFAQVNNNESLRKKVLKQVEEERKKS
jgi:uncharacterized protein DUF4168